MIYVGVATVWLAFLVMSFIGFALPDRYVRIAYFTQTDGYRRLAMRRHRRWSYRISNLLLFLTLLFSACRLMWMFSHR